MKNILEALRFLTNIPLGRQKPDAPFSAAGMAAAFPSAGILIGMLLAVVNIAIRNAFPDTVSALILISILTIITGGLHQDGLADTFDGLAGSRGKPERALEIMRDSRIGAMGALSLIISFLFKLSLIAAIPVENRTAALVLMPAIGRWNMVLPMIVFRYARDEGTAASFIGAIPRRSGIIATACMAVFAAVMAGAAGVGLMAGTCLTAWIFCRWVSSRLGGGITGDVLGAANEVAEISFLLGFYLLRGCL